MLRTVIQVYNDLNTSIREWPLDRRVRAIMVLEWVEKQPDIHVDFQKLMQTLNTDFAFSPYTINEGYIPVIAKHLASAMGYQKFWAQGPGDYLDVLLSLAAFHGQTELIR